MTGFFGVVSEQDCIDDVFYGADYHSHFGKKTGGMVILGDNCFYREIKDISNHSFKAQFDGFKAKIKGKKGIGVIGDYEPQPLIIGSNFGQYAISHIGKINNLDALVQEAYLRKIHFNEMSLGQINPVELIASLISLGKDYVDGIEIMQNTIDGSSSVMLLAEKGIYVARDKFGRTPIHIGKKEDSFAASFESFPFENLGFEFVHSVGPGEIGIITEKKYEQLKKPEELLQLCTFLFVYYGNPASIYENVEVENVRNRLGAMLAKSDRQDELLKDFDFVTGIPDSGTGSALGYAIESGLHYMRPVIKYVETWQRSFMPQNQKDREFIAKMKLIPRRIAINGKRILATDDSLVRGTQSQSKFELIFSCGAKEVHFRLSCPPLINSCKFLNFSINESHYELAARKAIREIEGKENENISSYIDENSGKHEEMVEAIRRKIGVNSLKYQKLENMVSAIGLPKERLCTYCWDGCDIAKCKVKI